MSFQPQWTFCRRLGPFEQQAGFAQVSWTDATGRRLANGTYLYRIATNDLKRGGVLRCGTDRR